MSTRPLRPRARRARIRRNAKPPMSLSQFTTMRHEQPEIRTRGQAFDNFAGVLAEVERTIKIVREKGIPFPPFGKAVQWLENLIAEDWLYNGDKAINILSSVQRMLIEFLDLNKRDPQFFPSFKAWPKKRRTLIDSLRDKDYYWTEKAVGPGYVCLRPTPDQCDVKEIIVRYDWDDWQEEDWLWLLDSKLDLGDMIDATTDDMELPPKLYAPKVYRGYLREDFENLGSYDEPKPGAVAYPWILQARKTLASGKRLFRPSMEKYDPFEDDPKDLYGDTGPWSDSWNDDPELYTEYTSDPSRQPSRKQIEKTLPRAVVKHHSAKAWNYPVPGFLQSFLGASHAKNSHEMRKYGKRNGWCFGTGAFAKQYRENINAGRQRLYFGIDPMTKQPVAVHTEFQASPHEDALVLLESTNAPPGTVEVVIEAKYPKNDEAFADLEEEYFDYNLARQEAKTNSSDRRRRKKRLPRRSRYSRRNGNDSPVPDPKRPYFKVPMKELVTMARQGDSQAAHELEVYRGRDPKTGKKMFGVAAKFSKGAT